MNLALAVLQSGGPGSGCHGDNCGRKPTGKLFISPNVEEGTHLDYAMKALKSPEHRGFVRNASKIVKMVVRDQGSPKINDAVGVWKDGAENSAEIQLHTDHDTQQYLSAMLGKSADQKAVLHWTPDPKGPHSLYTVDSNDSVNQLHQKLADAGVDFHTIIPKGNKASAIVLDQDGSLADKMHKVTKDNNYATTRRRGTGNFIGSWNSREEGKAAYNDIINKYESKHGTSYSRHLGLSARGLRERAIKDNRRRNESEAYQDQIVKAGRKLPHIGKTKPHTRGRLGRKIKPTEIELPKVDAAFNPDEARNNKGEWSTTDQAHSKDYLPERQPHKAFNEKSLTDTGIDSIKKLGDATTDNTSTTYRLRLADDSLAVFKPEIGENPDLESIRDNIRPGKQTAREVGAYQIAKLVGMDDIVAPTVSRTVNGEMGSVQAWQRGSVARELPDSVMYDGDKDLARAATFDYVIGNTDRNMGNWLLDTEQDKLHLIDHSLAFPYKPTGKAKMFKFLPGEARKAHELLMDEADERKLAIPSDVKTAFRKNQGAIIKTMKNLGFDRDEINGVKQRIENLSIGKTFEDLTDMDEYFAYGTATGLKVHASTKVSEGTIVIYKAVGMKRKMLGTLTLKDKGIIGAGNFAKQILKEHVVTAHGVHNSADNPEEWFAGLPHMSNGYMQFQRTAISAGGPGSGRHRGFSIEKPKLSLRQQRALVHYIPTTKADHASADTGEQMVREAVHGQRTADNMPFDVLAGKHAIEVKAMLHQSNDKITMRKAALQRKYGWAAKNNATPHTVVLDMRNGATTPNAVYYRQGVGSFRMGSMQQLPNGLADLPKMLRKAK
jgi:hypothetical protein